VLQRGDPVLGITARRRFRFRRTRRAPTVATDHAICPRHLRQTFSLAIPAISWRTLSRSSPMKPRRGKSVGTRISCRGVSGELGALIANGEDSKLDRFNRFGYLLGLAFQITDDVLNLKGDFGRYGKEIEGDPWEGKRTLVLARANRADRAWMGVSWLDRVTAACPERCCGSVRSLRPAAASNGPNRQQRLSQKPLRVRLIARRSLARLQGSTSNGCALPSNFLYNAMRDPEALETR
jgi:hypothetical protein